VDFDFGDKRLGRVWNDANCSLGHGSEVDNKFRDRVRFIRNAKDERDLRAMKSLHFERLKGARQHQWSIRIKDQWRLILEWKETEAGKRMILVGVEDYH
jgi:toxin HigB-1